jgi:uncharacterized repeat protein (TIGR03837 family)
LRKWFFYPGVTAGTGGLIREAGLFERLDGIDRATWLASHGIGWQPGERIVTLFGYGNPALPALIDALATEPTRLLLAGDISQRQARAHLGDALRQGALQAQPLPALPQPEFDALLRCSDLAFVRGEDSFVRAQWAGRPFVWQIYPQDGNAHAVKLEAFLGHHLAGAPTDLAGDIRQLFLQWNGLAPPHPMRLPVDRDAWAAHSQAWRAHLARQTDLTGQLLRFVVEKRSRPG